VTIAGNSFSFKVLILRQRPHFVLVTHPCTLWRMGVLEGERSEHVAKHSSLNNGKGGGSRLSGFLLDEGHRQVTLLVDALRFETILLMACIFNPRGLTPAGVA
jgi:hypothetical protein